MKTPQNHIIVDGEAYVEIGYGLMPTTRHQWLISSDVDFEKLEQYLNDNFIKCF